LFTSLGNLFVNQDINSTWTNQRRQFFSEQFLPNKQYESGGTRLIRSEPEHVLSSFH